MVADEYSKTIEEEMEHGLSICNSVNLTFLENFQIQLPSKNNLKLLIKINSAPAGLKTKELVDFLREIMVEGFKQDYNQLSGMEKRSEQIRQLMKLNKGYLEKLEVAGYITR